MKPSPSSRKWLRALLWAVALGSVYAAPRVYALWGIELAAPLEFVDMNTHMFNLDLVEKGLRLEPSSWLDPLLEGIPDLTRTRNQVKWPPGVYWAATPWAYLYGPGSIWTVLLTNLLFSTILVAGLLGLGWAAGLASAGRWAALLALLHPPLVAATCYLNLDYPLAAMVVFGLFLLLKTDHFRRQNLTLLFGIWSGLALAVKLTYALYLAGPCLAGLVLGFSGRRRDGGHPGLAAVHALAGAAVALLLCWVLVRFELAEVLGLLATHASAVFPEQNDLAQQIIRPFTLRWFLAIPMMVLNDGSWVLGALLAASLALAHTRWGRGPARWLLLASFWGGVLLLTLMGNKMARYVLPLYPALLLGVVLAVQVVIKARWLRPVLLAVAALFCLVLGLTHQDPGRWLLGQRSRKQDRYMYDMVLPSRLEIQGLRELVHHPRCQLQDLFDAAVELLEQGQPRIPLVVFRPPAGRGEQRAEDHILNEVANTLENYLIQENPHRVVMTDIFAKEIASRAGQVLLIGAVMGGKPGPGLGDTMEQVGRRTVTVGCGDSVPESVLDLILYERGDSASEL